MDYGTFLLCYYVIGYDLLGLHCVFAYVGMLCEFPPFGGEGEAFFFKYPATGENSAEEN